MMRFARVVSMAFLYLWIGVAAASAQSAAGTDQTRFYAEFDFGPTFGHQGGGLVGGEAGYHVLPVLDVLFEAGHMGKVGTSDLDARAQIIANAVGATQSSTYKVNYFDFGVRYAPPMPWMVQPYVLFGAGIAQVRAQTTLSVNGTAVPPETLGVQFGNDLDGTIRKGVITFGVGVTKMFKQRYFGDVSYRYAAMLARTGEIENDSTISTNRIQLGVGVKF